MEWCHLLQRAARWTHPSSGALTWLHPLPVGLNIHRGLLLCTSSSVMVCTVHKMPAIHTAAARICAFSSQTHGLYYCLRSFSLDGGDQWRPTLKSHDALHAHFNGGPTSFMCISHWTLWQELKEDELEGFLGGLTGKIKE